MLLRTTAENLSFYDVIVVNFGTHDVKFLYDKKVTDIPLSEYNSITEQLGRTGAKLVFLTTTPGVHNSIINQEISPTTSRLWKSCQKNQKYLYMICTKQSWTTVTVIAQMHSQNVVYFVKIIFILRRLDPN